MFENREQFAYIMYLTAILFSVFASLESTNPERSTSPITNSNEKLRSSRALNSSLNLTSTKVTRDMDSVTTSRLLDSRRVEEEMSSKKHRHSHKSQDPNISVRERNRTRQQTRHDEQQAIANFAQSNSSSNNKDNETVLARDKKLDYSKIARKNVLSEIRKDRNRPPRNRLYSKSRNKKPGVVTRKDIRSRRPVAPTSTSVAKTSNRETPIKKSARKQSSLEGRSKNRPHRHRHGRTRYSHRRRLRPKQPRRRLNIKRKLRPSIRDVKKSRQGETTLPKRPNQNKKNIKTTSKTTETTQPPQTPHTTSKDKDCPTCRSNSLSEETVRELKLRMFIKTMSDKLRLTPRQLMENRKKRPATRFPPNILEETMQDHSMEGESDGFYAKDQKVILPGEDLGRNCIAKRTSGCFTFDLAGKVRGGVASAQLWVYKTPDMNDTSSQTIILYGLERLPSGSFVARNQIERHDTNVREGWVVINVTRTVTSWVQQRKYKEMIAIRCATCVTRNHKAIYGAKHGYKPLIIIDYDKTSMHSRGRRSMDDCDPDFECCLRHLEINFRELRLTDIEAPPNLSVGYCYGHCNGLFQYTYNHTMMKQRHRYTDEHISEEMISQLKPCCVPVVLTTAPLLVRRGRSSDLVLVPNVVVNTCGCV